VSLPPVFLRPFSDADEALRERLKSPEAAGEYNTFDDVDDEPRIRGADLGGGSMIVETGEGTPVGSVSWIASVYGPTQRSVAWQVGITILPEHRRRGYGAAAQRVLAEHLFATTLANRVEATTDVTNVAEQGALERAGFVRESVVEGAQYRAGAHRDMVMYRILRSELDHS
jgi:RimJ/RimL family protein N-acetyltransferase